MYIFLNVEIQVLLKDGFWSCLTNNAHTLYNVLFNVSYMLLDDVLLNKYALIYVHF